MIEIMEGKNMGKLVGKIISLYLASQEDNTRYEIENMKLDKLGIIGDKFYNKNINRSVLLTSKDSYDLVEKNNIDIQKGLLGENIYMDFNPYKLEIGTQIQIENVILEISQPCTICDHLSNIDTSLPELLKNDRGVFVKVIQSGTIKKGDSIYLI